MIRDASHQQVIQKFSFIETLNKSRKKIHNKQLPLDRFNTDPAATVQQQSLSPAQAEAVKTKETEAGASAIVATANTSSTISTDWYQTDSTTSGLSLAEIINSASSNSSEYYIDHPDKNPNYLGKILFALAFSYCLFVLWWVFGHQSNSILTMLTGGKQIVLSKADVQFIDYMERSLDNIDRQLAAKREAAGNDEVVYVPVYTPSTAATPFPQVSGNLSGNNLPLTTLPRSNAPALPQPQPAPVPALKIPAPPPLPAPTALGNNIGQNKQVNQPQIKHTLIGVLELGENKSAALVNVQGRTRRVWLGEKINNDGWILNSVGNQRAEISYQGQIRSISVGETF